MKPLPGQFALPGFFRQKYLNFGMIFPEDVTVKRDGMDKSEQVASLSPQTKNLLSAARRATDTQPAFKLGDRVCQTVYGGDGVSGAVFCDNAEYRRWMYPGLEGAMRRHGIRRRRARLLGEQNHLVSWCAD